MKTILFLLIGFCLSTSAMAQQTFLTQDISIQLPKNTQKVNKEQVTAFSDQVLNNDQLAIQIALSKRQDYLYRVDNILISFTPANLEVSDKINYLHEAKTSFDKMFKRNKAHHAVIKSLNGNQFIIKDYIIRSIGYYSIICLDNNTNRTLSIGLQFDKADFTKASEISDDLLKSIVFAR